MLVLLPFQAECDRIGNGVAHGQGRAEAEAPARCAARRRRPQQEKIRIGNTAERFSTMMDIAVRRRELFAGQRRVMDTLILHVVRKAQRRREPGAKTVGRVQLRVKKPQADVVLVIGNRTRRAFDGRDVGTGRDV